MDLFGLLDQPWVSQPSETRTKPTMHRKHIALILITLGVTAGFVTITAGQASAALNHSEPAIKQSGTGR